MKHLAILPVLLTSLCLCAQSVDDLAKGGKPAILSCCRALVDVTKRPDSNDTQARTALHGLCAHARTLNMAPVAEDAILTVFAETTQPEVKKYLLEQLYYTAGQASVDALGPYLTNPEFCNEVTKIFVAMPDAAKIAGPAFLKALPEATGEPRYAIIQSLGELAINDAAPFIVKDAASADRRLRLIAIQALSNLDTPASQQFFTAVIPTTAKLPTYERSVIDGAIGNYLSRIATTHGNDALAIAKAWTAARPGNIAIACAAAKTYDAINNAASDAALLQALAASELRIRLTAKRLILANLTPARKAALPDLLVKNPVAAPQILDIIARTGDRSTVPAIQKLIASDNAEARTTAIQTLFTLLGKDALADLPKLLADTRDNVAATATAAAVAVPGSLTNDLVAICRNSDAATRLALITILEKRRETTALAPLATLDGDDDVTQAVCRIHGTIGTPDALPYLLKQLQNDTARRAAEKALHTCCKRFGDAALYLPAIKTAYATSAAEAKPALLKTAALAANDDALALLTDAWNKEPDPTHEAALRILADWPNAAALPLIKTIATNEKDLLPYVLAFRGCLKLIPLQKQPRPALAAQLEAMLKIARRVDERKLAIGAIGNFTDASSFDILLRYLQNDELKADAAAAVLNLSEKLKGGECVAPLRTAMPLLDAKQQERATACLMLISNSVGKIMRWQVNGPYRVDSTGYQELQKLVFPPEKPAEAAKLAWPEKPCDARGILNLNTQIEHANNVTAYARCILRVKATTKARLLLGSDDAAKVWLNGVLVEDVNVPRAYKADEDNVVITLNAGDNLLLVKIGQGGGDWLLGARLTAEDGGPLNDLFITLP